MENHCGVDEDFGLRGLPRGVNLGVNSVSSVCVRRSNEEMSIDVLGKGTDRRVGTGLRMGTACWAKNSPL